MRARQLRLRPGKTEMMCKLEEMEVTMCDEVYKPRTTLEGGKELIRTGVAMASPTNHATTGGGVKKRETGEPWEWNRLVSFSSPGERTDNLRNPYSHRRTVQNLSGEGGKS